MSKYMIMPGKNDEGQLMLLLCDNNGKPLPNQRTTHLATGYRENEFTVTFVIKDDVVLYGTEEATEATEATEEAA